MTKQTIAEETAEITARHIATGKYVRYESATPEGRAPTVRTGKVTDVVMEDNKIPMIEYEVHSKDGNVKTYKNRPSLMTVVHKPHGSEE